MTLPERFISEMRYQLDCAPDVRIEEVTQPTAAGTIYGWEEDGSVSIAFCSVRGYVLGIKDTIHLSSERRRLLYSIQIKGPDGTELHHEFEFGISNNPGTTGIPN